MKDGEVPFTVTIAVALAWQPLFTVYDIVVVPAAIPVILPNESTVAIMLSALVHTPPAVTSLSDMADAWHSAVLPPIAAILGVLLTLTATLAIVVQAVPLPTVSVEL